MKKVTVNSATEARTLSPFAYKDPIKTLEKSNQARVTLDGVKCSKSCVTKGRDVKAYTGMKYHVYAYIGGVREWMPISAEEYRAYSEDPGFMFELTSVAAEQPAEAPAAEAPTEQPVTRKGKKAQREVAEA